MTASTQHTPKAVASCVHIGPREVQQDRVIAHVHNDGSWVIAVFDGLGGHARGDEAAQAAADVFPTRIDGSGEMHSAIRTANAAVWNLLDEEGHAPNDMAFQRRWPGRHEPLTTVAAAAWTPQSGLQTAWMGDSVLFFVPLRAGVPGAHSEPQGSWDSPIMDNSLGFTSEPEKTSVGSMSDAALTSFNEQIDGTGLLVIAATDGLFDPLRISQYGRGGRFSAAPHDNSISFAIPEQARSDPSSVASALMEAAREAGLHDNAAVAVALARR